ncbi:hypothetical protein [Amycolatopsis sp. WQ 127309]|uniref:hypothetical protein n=1 Tax=Amycolatopsis sp. WQ 127309 TaxID=2932773 RepID=UPI001FF62361|nr:hypothetical protein [Amycolatopsis sp. WQ 127309]UOZ03407.1 hypothetical protein MUY22_31695 [Amycolatopsis sp. WQ 127309]
MVSTEEEITRRLSETDSVRKARRAQAATTVGLLARRHVDLAGQLAELERELGQVLTAARDVIDVPELADVTDIPAADLSRWREQAVKPARRRKRQDGGKDTGGANPRSTTSALAARVDDSAGS